MPILNSQINPHSPAFQENADALRVQVAELKELLTEVSKGGGEVAVARHKGRGKLTARERINALLDEGSPFLELAPIAAYPGDSGDVQQVSYISGGEAYFFSRGGVQVGRWEKASPEHPLKVYDDAGAELLFNRGKTYLAIVDDDEWSNFSYQ